MTWTRTRLKFLAAEPIRNGLGESGGEDNPDWPRYVRTTDIAGPRTLRDDVFASLPPEIANGAMLRRGDLVMVAAGATIGKTLLYDSDAPACYAGYLVRFRPSNDTDGRFIAYWMESQPFWDQIHGGKVVSTIENFSAGKYQNLHLRVPALDGQRAIADYLDAETARIDALIEKKRRIVELLSERYESWREKVMVEDESVSWIPLHHLTDPYRPIVYGIVQAGQEVPDGVPYIKTGDMTKLDPDLLSRTSREIDFAYRRARVVPGDIVIAMRASIGLPVKVPSNLPIANLTQGTARVAARAGIDSNWLFHALQCRAVQEQCQDRAVGTTFKTLNIWDLRRIRIPTPQLERQRVLVGVIEASSSRVTHAIELLNRQVESLMEHRQALVTAAVTGQLHIPGLAA